MKRELIRKLDGPLAVRTVGLAKSFGQQPALESLDLSVPEGAVYVLVGPNGAGKTTALKALVGLLRMDGGEAEVLGCKLPEGGAEARSRIGFVADSPDFGYPRLRVSALLRHHGSYFPRWNQAYAERLVSALEVPLEGRFGKLSKGQKRRVQLIQALAHRPALLLLDEPTDGLDPLARDRVFGLLAEHLAESPTTALISTHLVHELEGLGDCLGVLDSGRLRAQLRRDLLEQRLWRLRAEVPEDWPGAPSIEDRVLRRQDRGREICWTVWGDPQALAAELAAAGATVRHQVSPTLEEATRDFLSMEPS